MRDDRRDQAGWSRSARRTVEKPKMIPVMIVSRSRLRSTTVDPAIDPPSCPPPNMSDRPPPRPECSRIRKIIASADVTQTTMRMASRITADQSRWRVALPPGAGRGRACEGSRGGASGAEPDDAREVVRGERGATDESPVDVGHRHQLGDVPGLHAPAVLDPHRIGEPAVEVPHHAADDGDGGVRVVGRGVATGADRPDRFVRDDAPLGRRSLDPVEGGPRLRLDARVGAARLALLERLADADDRRHLVLQDRLDLQVHDLVGVAEELPALRVPDDDVGDVQLRQHRRRDLAGERALLLEVAVLRSEKDPELVALDDRLERAQVGEGRRDDDVARLVVVGVEPVRQLLHDLDRDQVVVVHLPVRRDDRLAARVSHEVAPLPWLPERSASRPGRSPCSMNSREAPPPVLTWSTSSANPICRIAAALSPPPTTVKPAQDATASATVRVPPAKGATSKTPIGPFQRSVPVRSISSTNDAAVSGPMSRPFHPCGTAAAGTMRVGASASMSSAATTSVGMRMRSVASRRRQVSTMSVSTSESPTSPPRATSNVNAIAPPTRIVSHRSRSASITPSLSLTFAPPSTARNGRFGSPRRRESTSTSRCSRRPPALGSVRGGPTIDA